MGQQRLGKTHRPRDTNQLAKQVVDIATGTVTDEPSKEKDPSLAARGRKGGSVGGRVRAARMTPEERSQAASAAAQARWNRLGK